MEVKFDVTNSMNSTAYGMQLNGAFVPATQLHAGRKDLVRLTRQAVSLTPVRLTSWFDRVSLTA